MKIKSISCVLYFMLIALILLFICECKKDENSLKIGQEYQGGIIAYILQKGDRGYDKHVQHGLIAAPYDQGSDLGTWWDWSYSLQSTNTSDTTIGAGLANTNVLYGDYCNGNSGDPDAALICHFLSLNNYSDWYLPSKAELNKLYQYRNSIGGFTKTNYWSSSEYCYYLAWCQDFSTGKQKFYGKTSNCLIRAVRSF